MIHDMHLSASVIINPDLGGYYDGEYGFTWI